MNKREIELHSSIENHLIDESGAGFFISPFIISVDRIIQEIKECENRYQYFEQGNKAHQQNKKSLKSFNNKDILQINNQKGRNHNEFNSDYTFINSSAIQEILNNLLEPLSQKYFSSHSKVIRTKHNTINDVDMNKSNNKKFNLVLTNIQVVDALPNSTEDSIWHADTSKPSLTFIIALSDQTIQSGPTQLITHSHKFNLQSEHYFNNIKNYRKMKLYSPILTKGQLLIFDSRMLHRGLKNTTNDINRPVLIIRYDLIDCPAPGMNQLGILFRIFCGWSFSNLHN